MDAGILLIFQNYLGRGDDAEMVRAQMHIADLAEPLGFDAVWPAEHHFTDYSACPDNVQFLTWLAGRTEVVPEDLHTVFEPAIAHRIFFTPIYEMRRSEIAGPLLAGILDTVASP